jgi:D-methionine transport system permease protein
LRALINATEKVPYIVFMIAIIPLTRIIIGSGEGSVAAVVPLTLASIPYFAKFSENAINLVPKGLIEAARAVGASSFQIVYKVLIPEALPNIISGLTTILTHLVGYSTIAGVLGAGGLGSLIIHKGYLTFQTDYVVAIVLTLVLLIQMIQSCGNYIASGSLHKNSSA